MDKNEDAENNESGNKKYFNQYSASTNSQAEPSRAGDNTRPANVAANAEGPSSENAATPVNYAPHEPKFKEAETLSFAPIHDVRSFRSWKK